MVMATSLDFTSRDILKCLGSNSPSSTEECEDHNFGQSPNSCETLSLNKDISHRPVRIYFLWEMVYRNNLIAASHQKHLETVILTSSVIARCHKLLCLSKHYSKNNKRERKKLSRPLSYIVMVLQNIAE